LAGGVCGLLFGLLWFAPASWLALALHSASDGRVVLASPLGTVWDGSARLEFSGGQGSKDATALPGRVSWTVRPTWTGASAHLNATCCTPQGLQVNTAVHWGGGKLSVADGQSHWPAALLAGLGTPWNTLQPEGDLQLSSSGLGFEIIEGRVSVTGSATVEARDMSSRLSTLRPMGSYRFSVRGGGVSGVTALQLDTLEGSLLLSGSGQWAGSRLRFDGVATAATDREAALSNLLNIIGRRDGVRSIITVG
jgi:general secretion pathway protein N